ncbi:Fic family protein [Pedobacter changchengzhani]|uniref:Fic family protein n=1 Tax=Pedobacter changchengzhani TaxID=2529274 RepID=A0A4R5MQ12_9SPHI|nr:Fic family protein [Pedobacter changchengzhani]TDG37901.1 Fic family protein [Pedobacter changchengzhani]
MLSKNLLSEIKRKTEELNSLKPLKPEYQATLDKKFRLEFNFNSNHLEGNTLTYGETELLLIFDQTEGTHDYREYQEMQAHDVALKMIQEEAADEERPLTENFIRSLNEKLLVKPFWKDAITADGQPTRKQIIPGEYKKTPNSVRLTNGEIFSYSAPENVSNEIEELVKWFNEKNGTEDPVLLAAILHYRFVRIHPFDDGNGRTARLLMNYVLAKNNLPLIIIKSSEKKEYLFALNKADTGDLNAFVEYIGNQLLWSLNLSIKAAKGENIEEDEDLDKELELLKQDLKQMPNHFELTRTNELEADSIIKSVIPLYLALEKKIADFNEFFVEVSAYGSLAIRNNYENAIPKLVEFNKVVILDNIFHEEIINNTKYGFVDAIILLDFDAFKKIREITNLIFSVEIKFEDLHYSISFSKELASNNEQLITKQYGSYLTDFEINNIVKTVMKNIISEIKSATNLNN